MSLTQFDNEDGDLVQAGAELNHACDLVGSAYELLEGLRPKNSPILKELLGELNVVRSGLSAFTRKVYR